MVTLMKTMKYRNTYDGYIIVSKEVYLNKSNNSKIGQEN